MRIGKFLEDVLGYDMFSDISKEYTVKCKYVDYAVKVDNKLVFFIEVKQAGTELRKCHIEQASNYAANAGIRWVILTSGRYWQAYHLTFSEGEGIDSDLVWETDILSDDIYDTSSCIGLLHKKSILKDELEEYFLRRKAFSPQSIVQAIFHEDTLKTIRKHLKKATGVSADEDELADRIKDMLSKEIWEEIGDVKIKRKRKTHKPKQEAETTPALPVEDTSPETKHAEPDVNRPIS